MGLLGLERAFGGSGLQIGQGLSWGLWSTWNLQSSWEERLPTQVMGLWMSQRELPVWETASTGVKERLGHGEVNTDTRTWEGAELESSCVLEMS